MTHNHTIWAIEGANCQQCSSIFEQVKLLSAEIVALRNRLRTIGNTCSTCFTSSFEPCTISHPKAVRSLAGYMYCKYCWLLGEHK